VSTTQGVLVEEQIQSLESALHAVEGLIEICLLGDRRRIARKLKQLRRQARRLAVDPSSLKVCMARAQRLQYQCEHSTDIRQRRAALVPHLEFPDTLPVSAHVAQLQELLERHQVLVVSGATGSGKSTQLPKLCLAAGRGVDGRIGHTQPRRIAARAIARRIAEETRTDNGTLVGHCVRFDDNLAPHTRVKVMTDGILLNEIDRDPWLEQYDTLIIDEVHERTLNIDFLLGHLKRVLARRPDLKVLITSATLDIETFTSFYDDCVSFSIEGRSFPIDVRYRPIDESDEDRDLNAALVEAVRELDAEQHGDVLVFLPGEREIREAHAAISRAAFAETEVLSLYARLNVMRQTKIFQPGAQRRIILATNVAETSLTVPRVRHVIDSGLARVSRYSPRRKLQQLPIEKIARANADQRTGRCGREAPGICIRLYDEADYNARRSSVEPEILRTNLAGVILRLKAMGIASVDDFPFAERPPERMLKDGYTVLQELGALDSGRALTPIGTKLSGYPIDPRLARVLVSAAERDCLSEILIIIAALSIADPRDRPHEVRDLADRAHAQFADKRSDFLWFVNAWDTAAELAKLPYQRQRRRCRRLFLSTSRVQEWIQLHTYLRKRVTAEGWVVNTEPASFKAIHCALASGFPSYVGEWQGDHYLGCRNATFALHPSSVLYRRAAKWLLVGEIVETGRPYARLAARIDPHWLDQVAGHLIKRTYEAPHWDARRGCARVTEIQRLFGLVINTSRQIDLARVDEAAARELLIEVGLLAGELGEDVDFLRHNHALVARIQALEARARRRDLLAPGARLHTFYDDRIASQITTRKALMRTLRAVPAAADALYMSETDATTQALDNVPAFLFPDTLPIAGSNCQLTYTFEPGSERDGVTITVPVALLPRLVEAHFDRLVPGMLSEKVEAMLRALPKAWRRRFSPAREYTMAAVAALANQPGGLAESLARVLTNIGGEPVDVGLFDENSLAEHLHCFIELVDEQGQPVAASRKLSILQAGHAQTGREALADLDWKYAGSSRCGWNFGDLPTRSFAGNGGHRIEGFPALVDRTNVVELEVFDDEEAAARAHGLGVTRLLLLSSAPQLRALERFGRSKQDALLVVMFGYLEAPIGLLAQVMAHNCVERRARVADEQNFVALLEVFHVSLATELEANHGALLERLAAGAKLRLRIDEFRDEIPDASRKDMLSQLECLLGPRGLDWQQWGVADRCHRYLHGINKRLERARGNPGKDLEKLAALAPLWQEFFALRPHAAARDAAARVHQQFEEYRISVFAPELGAAQKVSVAQLVSGLSALKVMN